MGHVGDRRGTYRVWWGRLSERDYLEDLGINERIILIWVFEKGDGDALTGLIWLRIGTGGGRL